MIYLPEELRQQPQLPDGLFTLGASGLVTVAVAGADAGYNNALFAYAVAEDGTIGSDDAPGALVPLLPNVDPGQPFEQTDSLPRGTTFGLVLLPDGGDDPAIQAAAEAYDEGEEPVLFLVAAEAPEGADPAAHPVTIHDAAPPKLVIAVEGGYVALGTVPLHGVAALNPGGATQALHDDQGAHALVAFEDLRDGLPNRDDDFDDLVVEVHAPEAPDSRYEVSVRHLDEDVALVGYAAFDRYDGELLEFGTLEQGMNEDLGVNPKLAELEFFVVREDELSPLPDDGDVEPEDLAPCLREAEVEQGEALPVSLTAQATTSSVGLEASSVDDGDFDEAVLEVVRVEDFRLEVTRVDGNQAHLDGVIDAQVLDVFEDLAEEHGQVDTLVFDHLPGSLDDDSNVEAALGVRAAGYDTFLPDHGLIASGGVDLFLAGVERSIEEGGRVGVHSWAAADNGEIEYQGRDLPFDDPQHDGYIAYYEAVGVGEEFYRFTLDAAPIESLHWMTLGEIEAFGVAAIV